MSTLITFGGLSDSLPGAKRVRVSIAAADVIPVADGNGGHRIESIHQQYQITRFAA